MPRYPVPKNWAGGHAAPRHSGPVRSALSVFLLCCAAVRLFAGAPLLLVTNSLAIHGHGTLTWAAPATWEHTAPSPAAPPDAPMAFRWRAPGNHPTVLVSVAWDGIAGNKGKPDGAMLAVLVKTFAEKQYAAQSVEKAAKVETVKSDAVTVSYASFTDPKFIAKEPPPDETRNMTVGMFRSGPLWGNFTLMTNDKDGDEFREGMALVRSLRGMAPAK